MRRRVELQTNPSYSVVQAKIHANYENVNRHLNLTLQQSTEIS